MQSSAAVTGRALIMLACVVGLPAFALSGVSWSEMLKKLQDFRWPAILVPASASTSDTTDPPAGRGPEPLIQTTPLNPARLAPAGQMTTAAPSAVLPAEYQELAATPSLAVRVATDHTAGVAPAPSDPSGPIQDRLKQLGATYYRLESWGNGQQLYRFYCKMSVGGSANYTRSFEATSAEPLQAMREVLHEVETWKEGGECGMMDDE